MQDWNVVITVHDGHFTRARQLLRRFGKTKRTGFYNVLVMKVEDIAEFQEQLADLAATVPDILDIIARVMPATKLFEFQSAEAFETQSRGLALEWVPQLAGKSFHARMHRRGLKEALPSQHEERMLDEALHEALENAGTPGRINFDDPDYILDV
jgi:tRNA(Ser,Leu) C12 N-acetylase TAN1